MRNVQYSVVVPVYNEEGNVTPLVEDLLKTLQGDDFEIILVNDNSCDNTGPLCDSLANDEPRVKVIHRHGKGGMGYALLEGSTAARGEYVFWVMGDCSDKLTSIREILNLLVGGYDMVIASRYMPGGSYGELGVDKAFYGSTYTKLARLFFRLQLHDITNAFRGFRKSMLKDVKPESGDFAISPEFSIRAHLKGYKLGEIPTTYMNRKVGKPKFKLIRMGIRYVSLLFTLQK